MKPGYLSVDIETTGLDPDGSQIIQFGAVYDDFHTPLDKLPSINLICVDEDDCYTGGSFALNMNRDLMQKISEATEWARHNPALPAGFCYLGELVGLVKDWLIAEMGYNPDSDKLVVAGKNYCNFDKLFLNELDFESEINVHHRVIDVGSMFWDHSNHGFVPPGLKTCLKDAGVGGDVTHDALSDCLDVIKCIRHRQGIAV